MAFQVSLPNIRCLDRPRLARTHGSRALRGAWARGNLVVNDRLEQVGIAETPGFRTNVAALLLQLQEARPLEDGVGAVRRFPAPPVELTGRQHLRCEVHVGEAVTAELCG